MPINAPSNALARKSLDRRLAPLRSDAFARPAHGWVRAVRDALGMTASQLAARMGVAQSTLSEMERGEVRGTVSLSTLRQAAEAMDCRLVYALVPNLPLEDVVRDRAREVAESRLARTSHTMRLENQALTADDLSAERARLVDELLRGNPRRLWDQP